MYRFDLHFYLILFTCKQQKERIMPCWLYLNEGNLQVLREIICFTVVTVVCQIKTCQTSRTMKVAAKDVLHWALLKIKCLWFTG